MRRAEVISELLRRANVSAPDLLAADVASALVEAGGNHLIIYVVDYERESLRPVGLASDLIDRLPNPERVAGTMAGRAFQSQRVVSGHTAQGWRVWAPLGARADQIGVLEAGFTTVDDETLALCEDLGRLLGHLVRTAARYTDLIENHRRRAEMSLPAELQWDMLLPPLAFRCPDLAIAGLLEPAYDVGGDGFDYCVNQDVLSFVFLDAMGHGLRSALANALVLAGWRHGRRQSLDLVEIVRQIDRTLDAEFDGEFFVTGQLGQLDVATGVLRWINAGHPEPLLVRGSRVMQELHLHPCLPLGLGGQAGGPQEPNVGRHRLEPGDRILFYSDGVIEARPASGEQFGFDRLRTRLERHLSDGLLAAETLRRIVIEVLSHRADKLQDDASLMLIDWRPDAI